MADTVLLDATKGTCPVCYCDIENSEYIACSNQICNATLCFDCAEAYVKQVYEDRNELSDSKRIPVCTNCEAVLLNSNIKKNPKVLDYYNRCCYEFMSATKGNRAQKEIEMVDMLTKLREERLVFIQETFPRAITLAARIAMPERLRSIDKTVRQKLKQDQEKSKRSCMSLMCRGSLGDDFVCLSCSSKFCKQCEKLIENNKHECKQEDVESIKEINNIVQCPKCRFRIFRASGCNNMTCSHCGCKFLYSSGEKGGSGSSNSDTEVKHEYNLHTMHFNCLKELGLVELMMQFEELKPPLTNIDDTLNKVLVEIYRSTIGYTPALANKLSVAYERCIRRQKLNKIYHRCAHDLEKLIIKKEITKEHIDDAIRKVKSV